MMMHTWHHPDPNRSPNRSRNPPLINRSQTRFIRMFDSSHRRHVFRHHGEVLRKTLLSFCS
jgi:hypothetical protein